MIMYCGRSRSFRASERLPLSQFQRVLNALPKFRLATTGVSRHLNANSGHPHSDLTVREREVLHWIRQGKRNAEIAVILNISPHTVRHHLENIFRKIGAETRTAAVHAFEF